MKFSIAGLMALLFTAWLTPAHAITLPSGASSLSVKIGGVKRTITAFTPVNWDGKCLIILNHGGGGSSSGILKTTKMDVAGVDAGCIVTVADGINGSWNVGDGRGSDADDMALFDRIISEIGADKVFMAGHSRGAMMAYHFACNRETLDAIAVSAGTVVGDCPDASGVDILHIYGTADKNVPYLGGNGWASAQAGLIAIVLENSCGKAPVLTSLDGDVTTTKRTCPNGTRMELVEIEGGGHAWPGSKKTFAQRSAGTYVCKHYDATAYIAQFFTDH